VSVKRVSERSIELRSTRGWGYAPLERSFCALAELPRVGEVRRADGLVVRVLSTRPNGLPERVAFEFDTPLDDPSRVWLRWQHFGPVRMVPPALGETTEIPGVSLLTALSLGNVPKAVQ
jgi:hypothetical protein